MSLTNGNIGQLNPNLQKAAEAFLPVLESKGGIFISMDDMDGLHVWSFKYRSVIFNMYIIYIFNSMTKEKNRMHTYFS